MSALSWDTEIISPFHDSIGLPGRADIRAPYAA